MVAACGVAAPSSAARARKQPRPARCILLLGWYANAKRSFAAADAARRGLSGGLQRLRPVFDDQCACTVRQLGPQGRQGTRAARRHPSFAGGCSLTTQTDIRTV